MNMQRVKQVLLDALGELLPEVLGDSCTDFDVEMIAAQLEQEWQKIIDTVEPEEQLSEMALQLIHALHRDEASVEHVVTLMAEHVMPKLQEEE